MRLMKRNLKQVWYKLYRGNVNVVDDKGYETGEKRIIYDDPVKLMCNVSPATGLAQHEQFGVVENYDKIIITDKMDCPINENTILYIADELNRRLVIPQHTFENYKEYVVRRVAKSLNHISYGVSEVKTS